MTCHCQGIPPSRALVSEEKFLTSLDSFQGRLSCQRMASQSDESFNIVIGRSDVFTLSRLNDTNWGNCSDYASAHWWSYAAIRIADRWASLSRNTSTRPNSRAILPRYFSCRLFIARCCVMVFDRKQVFHVVLEIDNERANLSAFFQTGLISASVVERAAWRTKAGLGRQGDREICSRRGW